MIQHPEVKRPSGTEVMSVLRRWGGRSDPAPLAPWHPFPTCQSSSVGPSALPPANRLDSALAWAVARHPGDAAPLGTDPQQATMRLEECAISAPWPLGDAGHRRAGVCPEWRSDAARCIRAPRIVCPHHLAACCVREGAVGNPTYRATSPSLARGGLNPTYRATSPSRVPFSSVTVGLTSVTGEAQGNLTNFRAFL